MKYTCPMPAPRVGDLTSPIFHLLALGVGMGKCKILAFALGVTNILVSPVRNCGVRGLS